MEHERKYFEKCVLILEAAKTVWLFKILYFNVPQKKESHLKSPNFHARKLINMSSFGKQTLLKVIYLLSETHLIFCHFSMGFLICDLFSKGVETINKEDTSPQF